MRIGKSVLAAALAIACAGPAAAREQIRIVGSSTVFPFTATVVEHFGQTSKFPAPILEATGTGGGFKLFCAGIGAENPDITGASRPMKASEFNDCRKNGVEQITELKIGYDGIVFAHSKARPSFNLTKTQLFQALAKEVEVNGQIVANPYKKWSDIDSVLPAVKIEVLGPPPTSGTRDAWVELVMETGCKDFPTIKALDKDRHGKVCKTLREDGAFIEAGENDNLIVQRLIANPDAFGIFGYSFLEQNADRIAGNAVGKVSPTYETIADGSYPIARALLIYVKNRHVGIIPGLKEFLGEYADNRSLGEDGYLGDKGLVTLPPAERAETQGKAKQLTPMTAPAS